MPKLHIISTYSNDLFLLNCGSKNGSKLCSAIAELESEAPEQAPTYPFLLRPEIK